jgi:hypothetical protein
MGSRRPDPGYTAAVMHNYDDGTIIIVLVTAIAHSPAGRDLNPPPPCNRRWPILSQRTESRNCHLSFQKPSKYIEAAGVAYPVDLIPPAPGKLCTGGHLPFG